jgi:hypothetical protein
MATGREPFAGADQMARLTALALQDPELPQKLNPALPGALAELMMWLLAKDPLDRPRSAQAVADALRAIEQQRSSNASVRLLGAGGAASAAKTTASPVDVTEGSGERKRFTIWQQMWIFVLLVVLTVMSFQLGQIVLNRLR